MNKVIRMSLWAIFGASALLLSMAGTLPSSQALAQAPKMVKSKIKVTLPEEDAELQIEKKATQTTGLIREFDTPLLEVGKRYEYEFVATWRPNNYTVITRPRTVQFAAGEDVVVDLTQDSTKDKAVIRFVPTPDDIVAEMIKLAKIGKNDVVFEPGCGDARMIIAAVQAGAKKAVGIDLDPERIAEAKAAVKAANLGNKIDIRQGDALEVKDYSDANVIMLYMGDEFDLLIRPTLWRELKVGTRIVSHRFLMGDDWKPDQSKTITGIDGEEYEIHLWTITEDVKKKAKAK